MDRRAADELHIPTICLMENAGAGAARLAEVLLEARSGPVACVVGTGNNGGDSQVVARHLALRGRRVVVIRLRPRGASPLPADAATQSRIVDAMGLRVLDIEDQGWVATVRAELAGAALIVDGVLGTGLASAPRGHAAALIDAINAAERPVLALDLPSGLDCDEGRPLGRCVRANDTATFVAPKLGFSVDGASAWTGRVHVVGIGAPLVWPLASGGTSGSRAP